VEKALSKVIVDLRVATGLSITQAAKQAGIAYQTLWRWEHAQSHPCAQELDRLLRVLNVPEPERQATVQMIERPRSRAYLSSSDVEETINLSPRPGSGDLWRAVRLRSGKSRDEVAHELRVDPSQISRWEKSHAAPRPEHLPVLFKFLEVLPNEQAALTAYPLSLVEPIELTKANLDEAEYELYQLMHRFNRGDRHLGELEVITWETKLWPLAIHNPTAHHFLEFAWTLHADVLLWQSKWLEMERFANRACEGVTEPDWFHTKALCIQAHRYANDRRPNYKQALSLLEKQQGLVTYNSATYWRDMANYAAHLRQTPYALALLDRSREAAQAVGERGEVRLADMIEARAHLLAGDAERAETLLSEEAELALPFRLMELLLWTQTKLALKERQEAASWLQKFYRLVEESGLTHMRSKGDVFAQQL